MRVNWFFRARFPRARPEPVASGAVLFLLVSTLHFNQFKESLFLLFKYCKTQKLSTYILVSFLRNSLIYPIKILDLCLLIYIHGY